MERRLTRQGEARKAELLAHAARLFAERGYQQTRVIDIVRSAGVAKGLFYWYFDNKDALFRELIGEMRERLRAEQTVALVGVGSPLGRLFAGTLASVRFLAAHRELYALMQIEGQTGDAFTDELRETTTAHARDTGTLIEAGQADGTIRADDDPTTLAHAVLATVIHLVYFQRTGRVEESVDGLATTAARFVTHAIAATGQDAHAAEREAMGAFVAMATN
ncbi:MAG TPA: TetR family transcriptional regulator [Acidimicrobiia bacterium]|nr:TetR family transcriptional regulator [Acidimicrobiia bacterium]